MTIPKAAAVDVVIRGDIRNDGVVVERLVVFNIRTLDCALISGQGPEKDPKTREVALRALPHRLFARVPDTPKRLFTKQRSNAG